MCESCWIDYGSPAIVTDKTLQAADLIAAVYCYSLVGGNAHIVLDDWNLEDEHVMFCMEEVRSNQFGYSDEQIEAELKCLLALYDMSSVDERASALAIFQGFVREEAADGNA